MSRQLLATGILGWSKHARQSKEYGHVCVDPEGYSTGVRAGVPVLFDTDLLNSLRGHRVRIVAVVIEARQSEHCGDMFVFDPDTGVHVKPSKPEVGEEVELGVGRFQVKHDPGFVNPLFGVNTNDDSMFQMDPERLYRLHDQTVHVYVERTTDPNTPRTRLIWDKAADKGKGTGDGCIQVNTVVGENDVVRARGTLQSLGDGMFVMEPLRGRLGELADVVVERNVAPKVINGWAITRHPEETQQYRATAANGVCHRFTTYRDAAEFAKRQ